MSQMKYIRESMMSKQVKINESEVWTCKI